MIDICGLIERKILKEMEIENIKKVTFWFENIMGFTITYDVIKSFELNEYQFNIGDDLVYKTKIILDMNVKGEAIPEDIADNWKKKYGENYYLNIIRRLYYFDDITELEIQYKDESVAKVRPYWGNFSQNEYSIYQKSYYEVNEKNKLTGNFIIEFFTDCFTDNFAKLPNIYELQKIIDDNFYKYNPLGLSESDKHVYHDYGLYEPAKYLFNLGNKANALTYEKAIYSGIAKQYKPEKHKKVIKDVVEIIFNEWSYKTKSLDE